MGTETKQIGQYTVYNATATVPTNEVAWYNFSWGDLRQDKDPETGELKVKTITIEAWYILQFLSLTDQENSGTSRTHSRSKSW